MLSSQTRGASPSCWGSPMSTSLEPNTMPQGPQVLPAMVADMLSMSQHVLHSAAETLLAAMGQGNKCLAGQQVALPDALRRGLKSRPNL